MAEITSGDYDALVLVQGELQGSLDKALQLLHRYINEHANSSALDSCIDQLHQTSGTVEMLNLRGAHILSSEIMASATALHHADSTIKANLKYILIKSLLLLPNYLKVISAELPDEPLRLISTINELRLARGEQQLNDSDLFKPKLSSTLPASIASHAQKVTTNQEPPSSKVSHVFQVSLLRWFKDDDNDSIQRLGKIFNYLRLNSQHERSIILWWSAAGVIEAVQDNGLIASNEIKSKIGKLTKPIELFTQHNGHEPFELFPDKLLADLLLLIAQSTSSGKHVTLLKNTFDLDFFNATQHQKIYNFSGNALESVRSELLDNLQSIKEQIDQFNRHADSPVNNFENLPEQLTKISDTLQLLDENSSGIALLQRQTEVFSNLISLQETPDDQRLSALADVLLQIEGQIKNIHIENEQSSEGLQLQQKVIKECLLELNHVKDTLATLAEKPENTERLLDHISTKLQLVEGVLSIISLNEAASLMQNTAQQIVLMKQNSVSKQELAWLADIIASCELYMESIQRGGSSQQLQVLINAQSILINFEQSSTDDNLFLEIEPLEISKEPSESELSIPDDTHLLNINQELRVSPLVAEITSVERYIQNRELAILQLDSETSRLSESKTSVESYIQGQNNARKQLDSEIEKASSISMTSVELYIQSQPPSLADMTPSTQLKAKTGVTLYIERKQQSEIEQTHAGLDLSAEADIDPEIAGIFIEEATEVLAEFKMLIPDWIETHNIESLITLRRHFHTLKGSGRMAGALVVAELAFSLEDLLNQLIDNTKPITLTVDQLLTEADALLPHLLSRFTERKLASTKQVDTLKTLVNNYPAEIELGLIDEDDELQQIFNDEAAQHIDTFKQALDNQQAPLSLNKELLRAAHSLKGCANIAQVMPMAVVATQLDKSLRSLYEHNISLDQQQLSVLAEVVGELEQFVEILNSADGKQPDIVPLAQQIAQLMPNDFDVELAKESEKLIDPEFLVVYLEETDDLLNQYNSQLESLHQQPYNSDYKETIHTTLQSLIDNSQHANLPVLVDLYQLLDKLTQYSEPNHKDIVGLIEQCYELINDQIELLIQNKPASDITEFKQQVDQRVSQIVSVPPAIEYFPLPSDEPELLEAFTEEFTELLESSGDAIKRWQQNHDDYDVLQQLQRDLHTIKGGARLTGLTPIAEISHQMESLIYSVVEQQQTPSENFFSLLQQSQDRLAEIQERLGNNESIPISQDILSAIAQYTGNTLEPTISSLPIVEEIAVKESKASGGEHIRVRADLLDFLTNFTGEVNISRDRVGQQNSAILLQLTEMESTVSRLQDQLRNLEIETETQILFRYDDQSHDKTDFDPLELDRFSMIQQLSRSLTESVSDMHEITQSIDNIVHDSDAILLQQSRLSADLEQGLMNTRLLPFTGLVPRFERIIRQVDSELEKQTELTVLGAELELDRTILDRIVAPLEHLIRNAIAHGIESPAARQDLGKNEIGQLTLTISREGSEILLSLTDDGQGINVEKVKQKAINQKLINPENIPSDEELIQLILTSGFSTSDDVSQISGRGVGMDVVSNEIRALKGRLSIQSISGKGTTFNIRLPLNLSIMQSLMVSCNDKPYAIPLSAVHAGTRATVTEIQALLSTEGETRYEFHGEYYRFFSLAQLLDLPLTLPEDPKVQLPILLFRYADMQIALLVDAVNSNREIVLKSVGEQLSYIESINGATILGDGQVVFILDIPTLVQTANSVDADLSNSNLLNPISADTELHVSPIAMVVDDSITMRKVSGNLLRRHGFEVITARDGIDAIAQLNERTPDIILLDVEMPRMDGFEFATLVRNIEQYQLLPIIMITSRTGDKHRTRALNIGVNAYLGKPYQELELVETMQNLLGANYPNSKR
ncbi:Hpt domain-containing protein [Pseudomonadota bacterium]|nr:Hpt domain-containing protein [Pseudomonadota bacterium]